MHSYMNIPRTITFVRLFSKFYQRHPELIVKLNIGLIQQIITEPLFMVIKFMNFKELLESSISVNNLKRSFNVIKKWDTFDNLHAWL